MAKNERNGLYCDLEFKTKVRLHFLASRLNIQGSYLQGFFSGIYNALSGRVRRNSMDIGEVSGRWSHVMDFKSTQVCHHLLIPTYRSQDA